MSRRARKPRGEHLPVARWVLFMPAIPAKPASLRVKVWRRLQSIGALGLRGSVYVLPNRDDCIELFEWVGKELRELGGQASLCEGRFLDTTTDHDIERRFAEARDADYAELAAAARELARRVARKRSPEQLGSLVEEHAKLVRRLDAIVAIDFVDAPGRGAAEGQLAAIARALPRPHEPSDAKLEVIPRPRGATWVTRTGVHIDRIASAWLIRRFIDPEARFAFVQAKGYKPKPGELRFDMFEAEFTHIGDRCTFQVLVERMGLADRALVALAEIIHDLDLKDDKYSRPETAGVKAAIDGICTVVRADEQRIAAAGPLLDGLHASFGRRP
jgi:hypothetical protein